jgi:hypothetical protein
MTAPPPPPAYAGTTNSAVAAASARIRLATGVRRFMLFSYLL